MREASGKWWARPALRCPAPWRVRHNCGRRTRSWTVCTAAEAARRDYGGRFSWSNDLHGSACHARVADLIDGRNLIAIMLSALNAVIRIRGSLQAVRDFDKWAAFLGTENSILLKIGLGVPRPRQFH